MEDKKDLIARIEAKIEENAKRANYGSILITEKPRDKPTVGIWWFLKNRVLKIEEFPENLEQEDMLCIPVEHNYSYPFLQKQYAKEIPELLQVRFNDIERGRVWLMGDILDSTKKIFVITCSTSMSTNYEAIQAIKSSFGIDGKRVKVEKQPCMYDREIKLK